MSQWAARKGQSLAVRALWRFGPAAATAVLLAVPSLPGSSHSHGSGHRPAPATTRHLQRAPGSGTVRTGTVSTAPASTGPGRIRPLVRAHRPGHFIKPD